MTRKRYVYTWKAKALSGALMNPVSYTHLHKYVIDTKGMPDSTAKLKAKLFHYKFPNIDYYWVSYSKIDGGWVTYEKLKAARANRKKLKSGGKC